VSTKLCALGGTFNPIHYGHLAAAEEVRDRLNLDSVLFIPSYIPPHKQEEDGPSAVQRLEMVRLAVSGNDRFQPSDIEIKRGGRSYTIDTIENLRRVYPGTELFFIIGLDSFIEIQTWHRWKELLTLCNFVVISRHGYHFIDLHTMDFMKNFSDELVNLDRGDLSHALVQTGAFTINLETIPLYEISSTDIRRRIRQRTSIKYLLPEPVETYIIKNKFYV
jgi:nicotinate-nucleotide adenylyltransferase